MKGLNIAALGLTLGILSAGFSLAASSDAPSYKVDPYWPKQLPNNWIMGQVGGVAVDGQDHVHGCCSGRTP